MGRGASRGKSGGMVIMKDSERKIQLTDANMTLFQYIQEGCFEKDFLAYCSNRLNDYSCIHWLDPDTSIGSSSSLIFPYSVNDSKIHCYQESEEQNLYIMKFSTIAMPILLFVALVTSILTVVIINRLSKKIHPLATYIVYLAIFDILELLVQGGDILLEAYLRIKVIAAIQILSRSSCQMLPFAYNLIKHANVILYMAMAIDNWKFIKRPKHMNEALKAEWIKNVLIVIAAILMTINAQFFWTFDVTENDNIVLHDRLLKSTFQCSFSTTWPLKQVFTEYIWPILDHMVGEIIPCIVCIYCGSMYFRSERISVSSLAKYIINIDLVFQMNYALSVVSILFGVFSLPRVIYFCFKYTYSSYIKFHKKSFRDTANSKASVTSLPHQMLMSSEVYFQYVEFLVKYTNFFFMIIKFLVLLRIVYLIRLNCLQLIKFQSKTRTPLITPTCGKCSYENCDCSVPTIKYAHSSVKFKQPAEISTLCSYTM